MKDGLLVLAKNLWSNHRKKLLAFLFGLLYAGLAAMGVAPLPEIKDAAKDAAGVEAPLVEAPVAPAVEAPKAFEKK